MINVKNVLIVILSISLVIGSVLNVVVLQKRAAAFAKAAKMEVKQNVVDAAQEPREPQKPQEPSLDLNAPETKMVKTVSDIAGAQGLATVSIETYSAPGTKLGLGSGFIVSEDGKIITNFHVVANAFSVSVKLRNGEVYNDASVIDSDEKNDVAILKIKAMNLPTVNLGDSDHISIGERVVVIGNPVGLENTVSDGIISAAREVEGHKMIQITAPISQGSSGGPVCNLTGDVIGIASSSVKEAQNLNFAVPINYVKPFLEKNYGVFLPRVQKGPEEKKGTLKDGKTLDLSEEERKKVWKEITRKKDDALSWVEQFYPMPDPSSPGYSKEAAKKQDNERSEKWNERYLQYVWELCKFYNLTLTQLQAIEIEGREKNWEVPKGIQGVGYIRWTNKDGKVVTKEIGGGTVSSHGKKNIDNTGK